MSESRLRIGELCAGYALEGMLACAPEGVAA